MTLHSPVPTSGCERRHRRRDGRVFSSLSARPRHDAYLHRFLHHHRRNSRSVHAHLLVCHPIGERSVFFRLHSAIRAVRPGLPTWAASWLACSSFDFFPTPAAIFTDSCTILTNRLKISAHLDVLAIAAHPDDVEQTCGGTLVRMAEMGYRAGVLDLTAGDMGSRGTPDLRIEESQKAAQHLLLIWRQNLRWPDARLENTITARMTLAGVIRRIRPRTVILPYWTGRHPDHYKAARNWL